MFFVKKKLTTLYLVRDSETGQYMGFDEPTVYWDEASAKRAIERQQGRRYEPKIQWKIVPVMIPYSDRPGPGVDNICGNVPS